MLGNIEDRRKRERQRMRRLDGITDSMDISLSKLREIVQRRRWHPTPVLLPGKSHGWRRLVGCSPWGCEESDTTERLPFHFSLSCIGEGNGNPVFLPGESQGWGSLDSLPSIGSHRVGHD